MCIYNSYIYIYIYMYVSVTPLSIGSTLGARPVHTMASVTTSLSPQCRIISNIVKLSLYLEIIYKLYMIYNNL